MLIHWDINVGHIDEFSQVRIEGNLEPGCPVSQAMLRPAENAASFASGVWALVWIFSQPTVGSDLRIYPFQILAPHILGGYWAKQGRYQLAG